MLKKLIISSKFRTILLIFLTYLQKKISVRNTGKYMIPFEMSFQGGERFRILEIAIFA